MLTKVVDKKFFNQLVKKYNADNYVKSFNTWDHFQTMLYAQYTNQASLRSLEINFNHFISQTGMQISLIKRSTLSDTNAAKPVELYQELFSHLVTKVNRQIRTNTMPLIELIDSTPIVLKGRGLSWADKNARVTGLKMHVVYDLKHEGPLRFTFSSPRLNDIVEGRKLITPIKGGYYVFDRAYYDFKFWHNFTLSESTFITRPKSTLTYKIIERHQPNSSDIIFDHTISLKSKNGKKHPERLRLIKVQGEVNGKMKKIKIITNNFKMKASELAALYKKRWQIELFFKWIKQNLKIKKFFGQNENAIKIQIITAMIAYILLKIIETKYNIEYRTYYILNLIKYNIYQPIEAIFDKPPPNQSYKQAAVIKIW